jgi:hypothetical protein
MFSHGGKVTERPRSWMVSDNGSDMRALSDALGTLCLPSGLRGRAAFVRSGHRHSPRKQRLVRFFSFRLDRCEGHWDALLGGFEPVGDLSVGVGSEAFLEHRYATG